MPEKRQLKTLTVAEVAERLRVRPERVRRWIKDGTLRASDVGTKARPAYRVRESVLDRFIEARAVTGIEG